MLVRLQHLAVRFRSDAQVASALGDEIWLAAADGHPQTAEIEQQVLVVSMIEGAPEINLVEGGVGYFQGEYFLSVPEGGSSIPTAHCPSMFQCGGRGPRGGMR